MALPVKPTMLGQLALDCEFVMLTIVTLQPIDALRLVISLQLTMGKRALEHVSRLVETANCATSLELMSQDDQCEQSAVVEHRANYPMVPNPDLSLMLGIFLFAFHSETTMTECTTYLASHSMRIF